MKKKINNIVDVLVIFIANFSVIVFGIWISAIPITKSKNFYMSHFNQNEIAKSHLTQDHMFPDQDPNTILEDVADITIDYYFGNASEYQVTINGVNLFNKDEVRHMKDVKELYINGQIIAVVSIILLVGCLFYLAIHFRRLKKKMIIVTCTFYGILLLLVAGFFLWGYISYYNASASQKEANGYFGFAFLNFHYLLFPFDHDKVMLATGQNGYDLYTLTRILNSDLFMDAGIIIGIVVVSTIIIWFTIVILFYKFHAKLTRKIDKLHEQARIASESFNRP